MRASLQPLRPHLHLQSKVDYGNWFCEASWSGLLSACILQVAGVTATTAPSSRQHRQPSSILFHTAAPYSCCGLLGSGIENAGHKGCTWHWTVRLHAALAAVYICLILLCPGSRSYATDSAGAKETLLSWCVLGGFGTTPNCCSQPPTLAPQMEFPLLESQFSKVFMLNLGKERTCCEYQHGYRPS